jgi:hypothetical protein
MAVRYMDDQHKDTSGYIVSGKEAQIVKQYLFDKSKEAKLETFKKTSAFIKKLIKTFQS